jgi:hypothetical protein
MRNTLKPLIASVCAMLAWQPAAGQVNAWPQFLVVPAQPAAADSNRTVYGSDQNLYIHTFKSRDSVSIQSNTALYGVNQSVDYELKNDSWFDTKDQFYDLSGSVVRKELPLGLSAGLEWTPVLILNKRTLSQGLLGSIEAGPVASAAPLGIPVELHGGGTARGWNDSLDAVSVNDFGLLSRDKGFYAGGDVGSLVKPLPLLPLIVDVRGYGRSMETSKLISGTAFALLYAGFPSGDSCFAMYADSLTNGKDAFLGQAQGKPHFIDDPEKTERSYQISAGIRGRPRFWLVPGAVYSYNEHYLSYRDVWGDKRNTDNSINLVLGTDSVFPVSYAGGIKIDWEREDKHSRSSVDQGNSVALSPELQLMNLEGKLASLDDYQAYRIEMINTVSKYFRNGIGAEYTSDISRYSKDYPVYYVSNGDTIRPDPPQDNDLIVNRQKFTLVPIPSAWGKASLFVEYSNNYRNYIKKEMSGNNEIDQLYRVGGNGNFIIAQRCTVSEAMSSDVKTTGYVFPETKRGSPPPYSRKWSSLLFLDWAVTPWLGLKTEWNEIYCDFGTWNAREYLDTTTLKSAEAVANYHDYYAIVDKSWEHEIKLTLAAVPFRDCRVTAGCCYQYIDSRQFNVASGSYDPIFGAAGTRVMPFASITYQLGAQAQFNASFARTFDILNKFWDIHVSLTGAF